MSQVQLGRNLASRWVQHRKSRQDWPCSKFFFKCLSTAIRMILNGNLFRQQQNLNLTAPEQLHSPAKPQCWEPLGAASATQGTQLGPHSWNDAQVSPTAKVTMFFHREAAMSPLSQLMVPHSRPCAPTPILRSPAELCGSLWKGQVHLTDHFCRKGQSAQAWSRRKFHNFV